MVRSLASPKCGQQNCGADVVIDLSRTVSQESFVPHAKGIPSFGILSARPRGGDPRGAGQNFSGQVNKVPERFMNPYYAAKIRSTAADRSATIGGGDMDKDDMGGGDVGRGNAASMKNLSRDAPCRPLLTKID